MCPKTSCSSSSYFFVSDFTIFQSSLFSPEICAFITPTWISPKSLGAAFASRPYPCLQHPHARTHSPASSSPEFLLNLSGPLGLLYSILEWLHGHYFCLFNYFLSVLRLEIVSGYF